MSVMNTIKRNMDAYKASLQRARSTTNNEEEYAMEEDTSDDDSVITTSTRSNVSRKSTRIKLRSQQVSEILPRTYQCS